MFKKFTVAEIQHFIATHTPKNNSLPFTVKTLFKKMVQKKNKKKTKLNSSTFEWDDYGGT